MFFWANPPSEGDLLPLFPSNNLSAPHSLLDLLAAESINWEHVAARAREEPHELRHRDAVRNHTPLFLAIQRDAPPFVIDIFLQVYPEAARQVQRLGLSPLHLSVARGSPPHVVKSILDAWPDAASKQMSDGCVPLHFVRNVETARLLIDACPNSLHIANNASYIALHRAVTASYSNFALVELLLNAENGRHAAQQLSATTFHGVTPLGACMELIEFDIRQAEPVCLLKWKKLEILARAFYIHHQQQYASKTTTNSFCFLHALLQARNPSFLIIQYILQRHPDLLAQIDDMGRSAVAIAASRRDVSPEILRLLLSDSVLRSMAGKEDASGRWPLHCAAASGRRFEDGLEELWSAAPLALTTPDAQTGLYPSLLAAIAPDRGENGESSLNTIFSLLRETPWLIPRTTVAKEGHHLLLFLKQETIHLLVIWFLFPLAAAILASVWMGIWWRV